MKKITGNIKRYGGDIAQKALNNYMDTQEELLRRGGDYSLRDYSSKTVGDVAAGLVRRAGKPLFGEPVNRSATFPKNVVNKATWEELPKPVSKPFKLDEDEIDGLTPPEYA